MVRAFGNAVGWAIAVGAATLGTAAEAWDDPPPPPPCPLTATLRIADEASLRGIQSLSQCTAIVAPAMPGEASPPPNIRISPDQGPAGPSGASFRFASASARDAAGPMRVAAIAPRANEPASLGPVDAEGILAMRPMSYTTQYDAVISRAAARHRIDPLLLHAVIDQESRYRANATSRAGARGLMQLMPGTARMLNVPGGAITDPEANVDGGARLLRRLHGRFNDFTLTLAAYNAGEGAVLKYGNKVPPYPETQDYVRKVLARYDKLVAEQTAGAR